MSGLSIGKLAKAAKVSIHTIRFYEKSGLLPQPSRRPSGFREYSELDVLQLKFVREARSFGFSVGQISELLALGGEQSSASVRALVDRRLKTIDQKIARLVHWRKALQLLLEPSGAERSKRRFLLYFFNTELANGAAGTAASESRPGMKHSDDET